MTSDSQIQNYITICYMNPPRDNPSISLQSSQTLSWLGCDGHLCDLVSLLM